MILNSLTTDKPVALGFLIELEFGNVGFCGGRKTGNPEKNPRSKDENQQQSQPTYDVESGNRTRATLVGGKCSHHCANHAQPCAFQMNEDWPITLKKKKAESNTQAV